MQRFFSGNQHSINLELMHLVEYLLFNYFSEDLKFMQLSQDSVRDLMEKCRYIGLGEVDL